MITDKKISFATTRRAAAAALVCALGASATACAVETLPEEGEAPSASAPSEPREATSPRDLSGTLLAEAEIQPGHRVRLWELGPGDIVVTGRVNVDQVPEVTPLFAPGTEPGSAVDIYKTIMAKAGRAVAEADVPASIREASERAELLERELVARGAPEPVSSEPEVVDHVPIQTRADECSEDLYEDDYGAQWFRDNYCNRLFNNYATTNVASWSGEFKWETSGWVGFAYMSADFEFGSRFSLTRYSSYSSGFPFGSPSWGKVKIWDNEFLGARWAEYWYGKAYGGRGSIQGEGGPCARVHACKMKTHGFIP